MLKKRIIPTLLTDGSQCVKPISFQRPYRKLGPMSQYVRVNEKRNIDEIIILDIEATAQNRNPHFDKIKEWCSVLFCPVTYGGGILELDDIKKLIGECGIDKVAIKTNIELIEPAAKKFGSQAIVYVNNYGIYDEWQEIIQNCKNKENEGAGEILLTSLYCDGRFEGYDIKTYKEVCYNLNIPVVINGGCRHPSDMLEAIQAGASAVAAGSIFLYREWTPRMCAQWLKEYGIYVRLD